MVAGAPAGFVKVNLVEMSVANVYCGTPCCVAPCDHLMTSTNPFKFVAPDELKILCQRHDLQNSEIRGLNYNILQDKWNLSANTKVNYISIFKKF